MEQETKMYTDEIYGFIAHAVNRTGAWMLIRNKCHELDFEVPTIDKIVEL